VYHHSTILAASYFGDKYVGGGNSFILLLLNSLVHTVMYAYYGLAALGPHMQPYLWWKMYLTQLQLVKQLSLLLINFLSF
jgi:elongation of very long chain fatty acids protein 4